VVVVPTTLEELPQRLAEGRGLLSLDVDPLRLPCDLIAEFVAAGGGWLHCAGLAALRAADRAGQGPARARELLALWPAAPPRPPRDVLLLIDGSGSMAGEKFEALQAAALELAGSVPPSDRLLLAFFSSELGELRLLRDSSADAPAPVRLAALLGEQAPGGSTDVLASLAQLAERRAAQSRELLALLLSDGRDPTAGEARDLAPLKAQLARARIRLEAFAFGADAQREFLTRLLPAGQVLIEVEDPTQWSALLARALDQERVRENTQAVAAAATEFPVGSPAEELSRALAQAAPRALQRIWLAQATPDAAVLWRTREGDPLLALRQFGLGMIAGFASTPAPDWAPELDAPSALGPLLRALARGNGVGAQAPRASLEDGVLWVRELPADTPARIQAVLPSGELLELTPPADFADQPLSTRQAPLAGALLGEPAGDVLQLRDLHGGVLASVSLGESSGGEFWALPIEIGAPAEPAPAGASLAAHPAAFPALHGALGLLAAALILGLGRRP
jgi:hypothetical protein